MRIYISKAAILATILFCNLAYSQTVSISPGELRQIQSRQFKTSDLTKVSAAVMGALNDADFTGHMGDREGHFLSSRMSIRSIFGINLLMCPTEKSCRNVGADILLKRSDDKKLIIVRISLVLDADQSILLVQPEIYQSMFASISKSLFIDAQQIPMKSVQ